MSVLYFTYFRSCYDSNIALDIFYSTLIQSNKTCYERIPVIDLDINL